MDSRGAAFLETMAALAAIAVLAYLVVRVGDRVRQAQPTAGQGTASGAAEDAAEDSTPGDVPPADATLLEQALEESGVEWGNLPDRVRDMIRQGLRERPSSLYERLTEAYYRRLAEESSR